MLRASAILALLIVSAAVLVPQSVHAPSTAHLLYTVAREYEPLAWLSGGERFPRGANLILKTGATKKPLQPDFFASADANVSFAAAKVLFSGKQKESDHWQVWELTFGSGTPRQLTHCDDDCIRPLYLPEERFVYARKSSGKFVLETAALSGASDSLQLTHTPGNFLPSDVLQDGRILFAAAYPLESSTSAELYTVYPDGSGVEAYRCDHGHSRHSGKQVSSGGIVFVGDGRLFRFTSALAHEVAITTPAGSYAGDVAELANGVWMVSAKTARSNYYDLRTWKPGTAELVPLIAESTKNIVEPTPLASRPVPNRFPSALHEWSYANVLCLNAYTSKDHIAEGSIASVRLYTRDALGAARVQGSARVEKDGSFYLRVPGDQPLRIELLDSAGKSVKTEAGWFWLRRGEQRICVGCHAGPERAPDNAVPLVLQRSTIAADMTGQNSGSAGTQ